MKQIDLYLVMVELVFFGQTNSKQIDYYEAQIDISINQWFTYFICKFLGVDTG